MTDLVETGAGAVGTGVGADTLSERESAAGLEARYRAYRRRQGSELLSIVPREAIRPLYRRALDRAAKRGEVVGDDAVGALVDLCSELLPLPPFEVWKQDFLANRAAHLEESGPPAPYPEPVTVEVRSFADAAGAEWYASLDVAVHEDDVCRGTIAFHRSEGGGVYRTAEIFREADPATVRRRFLEFDRTTLRAFLRSVLP